MDIRVASLHVYPVKACRGIDRTELELSARGPRGDREFMIIRPDGRHVSQREVPRLATVTAHADGDVLALTRTGGAPLRVPIDRDGPRREVTVHRKPCLGIDQGAAAAGWLTDLVGLDCRLVWCPPDGGKQVNPDYGDGETGYVDGYPVSVVSTESLAELNSRLAEPVPMARFRPNLVVSGMRHAHAEDDVQRLAVGTAVLRLVKQDDRCVVTTIDQVTGARTRQPLRTLAGYRLREQGILFGMYAMVEQPGTARVGDPVTVLSLSDAR